VFGNITTTRVSIEDGADFKGRIEINHPEPRTGAYSESVSVPVAAEIV
jgi:cytoskeletal protein CcmA (bactofilin family)